MPGVSTLLRIVIVWVCALSVGLTVAPVADAGVESGGRLVSAVPAAGTPSVLDGEVRSVAQVGRTMVVGGSFTQVRDAGSTTILRRRGLFAFDAVTGRVSALFHPDPNRPVDVVRAGPAGTVFVGGSFTTIGGRGRQRVAKLAVANGAVDLRFDARRVDDEVRDLRVQRGRLWVAGSFSVIGGRRQRALAALDTRTGLARKYFSLRIHGLQRKGKGTTTVVKIDISPDQRHLVAIGNFRKLERVTNRQLLMLRLTRHRARPAPFRTAFYAHNCNRAFYSYVRDLDFSPDGRYFVVASAGGPTAYAGCDAVARFESRPSANAAPSWVARTGGDTLISVEVTPSAVYVGGHQRWFNNPYGRNTAGPGAVRRNGLAALSPSNGLPFSWDPGRTRGVGVFDFLATTAGLWVASDTDRIGGQQRDRIARFDAAGGTSYPSWATPLRAGRVYRGATAPAGGPRWAGVGGAFMLGSRLYVGSRDGGGIFTRRTFDGRTYGPVEPVRTADAIVPLASWRDDLRFMTGMFYDRGRIYFTRAGSSLLYYRYFNPESGIVGAARLVATKRVRGFDPARVRGMYVTRTALTWATPNGVLHRIRWRQTAAAAVPVGRPAVVGGPRVDGIFWAGALFVGQGAAAGQGG